MKYPEQESSILKFKEAIPQNNQIAKTTIGFCNHKGGRIIIGIKDDSTIVGLTEEEASDAMEYLHKMIYESSSPPIIARMHLQKIAGKHILIIEVSPGMNKPYFIKSEGLTKGTYIRVGRSTVRATPDIIEELTWSTKGRAYDAMPVYGAQIDALDRKKIQEFLKIRKGAAKVPTDLDKALRSYQLITDEHTRTYPTVAGVLLFGKDPQMFYSEAFIIASRFAGIEGREALATRDCSGTLMEQYADAYHFIVSQLNRTFVIKGPKRIEQLEIPEVAIREAVLNAVVHRNYAIKGPSKIAIYDNRVEIFSPGDFPGPLTVDNLLMGLTYIRNPAISKVFREAGYVEKLGSGIPTIFESYRKKGLRPPEIIEGPDYVKYILPRPRPGDIPVKVKNDALEKILHLFESAVELSSGPIAAALNIPRNTIVRKLNQLIEKNLIKKIGEGSKTRYVLRKDI